ncbi:3-hydroxyacyl-ACP dehydratase FabZ family protein [Lignipirellula cremea]|uniref:3-hydroxyacyl-[acyl-carrier-protein] dehydratase FabZ n=1 Tax=Lignipirellula cremea TaxID=2528010 RepID=A0A518DWG4_9BACT|nr:3-hydroxyacyl-ACP dehydratase FabZ family protein [Lignipirellula cremea]QDU96175.1 3-hydroxyacyl-[acyl-carrier-protein] dehydratase FabZ [Lignipirellula cremea]
MRFRQLDRITELVPGERITAIKALTLSEEYLEDHFPRFPVMPGVVMLESMFQASMWLIHATEEFRLPIVTLKECRNVKYSDFVQPGDVLRVEAQILKHDETSTTLKTQGFLEDGVAVGARLILERYSINERHPARGDADSYTRRRLIEEFRLLYPKRAATA